MKTRWRWAALAAATVLAAAGAALVPALAQDSGPQAVPLRFEPTPPPDPDPAAPVIAASPEPRRRLAEPPRPLASSVLPPISGEAAAPVEAVPAVGRAAAAAADAPPAALRYGEPAEPVAAPSGSAPPARAAVEVRQRFPEVIRGGQPATVELTVTNHGPGAVDRVVVTDDLPPGAELIGSTPAAIRNGNTLVWSLGALDAGQSKTLAFRMVLQQDSAEPVLRNQATARFEASTAASARVVQPKLVVDAKGPPTAVVGGALTWDIRVTNRGNAPATNVVLRDVLPASLVHPAGPELETEIGKLGVGETRQIALTVSPSQAGEVTNRLVVTADGVRPVERAVAVAVHQVELALSAVAAKTRFLNRPCEVQLAVANKGATDATQARLVAALPRGMTFVHATDGGMHDEARHEVWWTLGKVRPGETRQVSLTAVGSEMGEQVCRATLTSTGNLRREATCATTVVGVPALRLDVSDTKDPVEKGDETVYEMRVTNAGSAVQTNLKLTCAMSPELQFVDAKGPARFEVRGEQLVYEPVARLEPKATVMYKLKARTRRAGDGRVRVELSSDQHPRPILREENTTIYGDDN